ncbi:alpha-L-fucosidase [Paenibacillus sp. GCM10023248]|uniref:alpha-L-fucosidase n=1 Tax=unclassified Paenibacillus TaxID=185978 RepID=UPI0023781FAF|nr:alpha-L-fucosidase [Paenibacillus sp. MAHUQ-63]MDD9267275.1 alpha-L-fucosidase [Paenibacillus sp. MAHUQ-63]
MMIKYLGTKIVTCVIAAACMAAPFAPIAGSAAQAAAAAYEPNWPSVDLYNAAPDWFRDAKFGIYFHWGAFSVPAYGSEWYPRNMYKSGSPENQHHYATYGDTSAWPYSNFLTGARDLAGNWKEFAPKLTSQGGNFDPEAWAQLFVDAGAKFAGPVAEHHDGYSMWDSKVNEWNSVKLGPKLDLVSQFSSAIRSKNLKLLLAMHHAYNYTGFYEDAPQQTDPSLQKLYGQLPRAQENQLWYDKLEEVVDNYQPDILWQDFDLSAVDETQRLKFLSHYYNKAMEWNKEVVATYKDGYDNNGEVYDYERGGPGDMQTNYWLTDDSVSSTSWSYTNNMGYYSTKAVLDALIDRVSKNGSMLLNIAPTADGTIPQEQKDILLGMGDWLNRFGESIYATRAWDVYGEGPTKMGGGIYMTPTAGTNQDIRYTRNKEGNALYGIVMGWPGNGATLNLSNLNANNANLSNLSSVQLLGSTAGTYINLTGYTQDTNGLQITMPSSQPYSAPAYVVKLSFSGPIPALNSTNVPRFYTGVNYGGNSGFLGVGSYTLAQMQGAGIPNDSISSVRLPAGYNVTLYTGDNFSGNSWKLTGDNADLRSNNGTVSSIRVSYNPAANFKLTNHTDGLALDGGGSVSPGSDVKQWTWDSSPNLQWNFIDLNNGYFAIKNRNNGLAIDSGGNVSQGASVKETTWTGSNNQQWQIVYLSGGYFKIVNRTNGMVLDSGGHVSAGSSVLQWSWNGNTNQQWKIEFCINPAPALQQPVTFADVAGLANNGKTKAMLPALTADGNRFWYKKVGGSDVLSAIHAGDSVLNGWTAFPADGIIEADNGQRIFVAEADTDQQILRVGEAQALVANEDAPVITALTPVNVKTVVGVPPVLPALVTAAFSDNTTADRAVQWANIDPSKYAAAGSFSVNGVVSGTSIPAVAHVTVTDAVYGQPSITSISVSGIGGVNTIMTQGATLQMQAIVLPAEANSQVAWSVWEADGVAATDKAAITAGGRLTANTDGIVKVVATAVDGSGMQGSTYVVISGQTSPPTDVPHTTLTGAAAVQAGAAFSTNFGLTNVKEGASSAIYAADLMLSFDAKAVEFVSVDALKSGFSVVEMKKDVPGQLRIIAISEGEAGAITASGELFKLNWKAKPLASSAATNLALTKAALSNARGHKMDAPLSDLAVTVTNSAVNKTTLQTVLSLAQTIYDRAVEGTQAGQYAAGSKAVLLAAIQTAAGVGTNPAVTQQQSDDAANVLNQAIQTFNQQFITDFAPGDVNHDTFMNIGDLGKAAMHLGKKSSSSDWNEAKAADFNHDGVIDIVDVVGIARLILQ